MGELAGSRLTLNVTGFKVDLAYAAMIETMAAGRPEIRLDLRSNLLPEADLEAAIDEIHGVVLPYRDILNSGSSLLALSRNRPVLAPRLGSLPEMQAHVGKDWLHLYDGALSAEVLRSFADRLHSVSLNPCNLSAYDWAPIAQSLHRFIDEICADDKYRLPT
jgi:beta-1,4-mannosyltransferase